MTFWLFWLLLLLQLIIKFKLICITIFIINTN